MNRKLKWRKRYNFYTLPKARTNISNTVKDLSWSVFLHWGAQNSCVKSLRLLLRGHPKRASTSCFLGTESRWGFIMYIPAEPGTSETKLRKNLVTGIWTIPPVFYQFLMQFSSACLIPQNLSLLHQDYIHDETGLPGMLKYKDGTTF